jgi:hypothetical protein
MTNLFKLIFDHRSCIKKLKILIHPDKRPNDRKVAEEEWKQLDTVLSTLTASFPSWKDLSNWEELQYVFQHATEFKSQQTAINDGALCVFVMIEYLNSELDLAKISQRFQLDFKSQYTSLSATQLNDVVHRICIDIRLMSKDNHYHPSIVESQTMIVEEEIVVNDNKYWKQLICQKLGLSINEYSDHFIMNHFGHALDCDGLMQDCVNDIPVDIMSFVDETELSSNSKIPTDVMSMSDETEVSSQSKLSDSLSCQETNYENDKVAKYDENIESNTEIAQGPQSQIFSSDDIVGPQLFETDSVVKKQPTKRKNTKREKQKSKRKVIKEHKCNNLCKKLDKTLTLRRFVPQGSIGPNRICYEEIVQYLKKKPNSWQPRQDIVDFIMKKKDSNQLQPLKCLFTKLYQNHCCFTDVVESTSGLLMMGREVGKRRRLFFRFNE